MVAALYGRSSCSQFLDWLLDAHNTTLPSWQHSGRNRLTYGSAVHRDSSQCHGKRNWNGNHGRVHHSGVNVLRYQYGHDIFQTTLLVCERWRPAVREDALSGMPPSSVVANLLMDAPGLSTNPHPN